MTLDAMRAHIDRLIANLRVTRCHFADDLDIRWIDDREEAMAITDADPVEIHLPHIRSALDYATCLHELGHVNGRYQGSASSFSQGLSQPLDSLSVSRQSTWQ